MRSTLIRTLATLSILACTPMLSGCFALGTPTPPRLLAFDCAKRVPPQLRDKVEGVDLPDGTLGSYIGALDGQTGKLDQANDEKDTVIWIYDTCEAERHAVQEELRPKSLLERLNPFD